MSDAAANIRTAISADNSGTGVGDGLLELIGEGDGVLVEVDDG